MVLKVLGHSPCIHILLPETELLIFKAFLTNLVSSGSKAHIRKTLHKDLPAEDTIKFFQHSHIWQMENEFYLFAKEQFEFVKKQSTVVDSSGRLIPAPKRYRYEKIRGPILPGMKVRWRLEPRVILMIVQSCHGSRDFAVAVSFHYFVILLFSGKYMLALKWQLSSV